MFRVRRSDRAAVTDGAPAAIVGYLSHVCGCAWEAEVWQHAIPISELIEVPKESLP